MEEFGVADTLARPLPQPLSLLLSTDYSQVYQIVRKLYDEADENAPGSGPRPKLTSTAVYDYIKRSNSSLKRRPKKPLEDSIERVLDVILEEQGDDSSDGEFGALALDDPVTPKVSQQSRGINKAITKMWTTSSTASPLLTPVTNEPNAVTEQDRSVNGEPKPKKRKAERQQIDRSAPTHVNLEDLGGVDDIIEDLVDCIAIPMLRPHLYTRTGIEPTRGVLLHGPPGCGKTMIANAFAAEMGVSFIPVSAPSLVAGMSGESEKKVRDVFEEAKRMAPCLVFIDEIDVIMGKRETAQREMEKRIVAQMLTCMDDIALDKTDGKPVIVIAATNRPDSLDPAMRRAGRFNKEINVGVPNEAAREKILIALTQKIQLPDDFAFRALAKLTPGFVGADLKDVVSVAGTIAIARLMAHLKDQAVDTDSAMDIDVPDTKILSTPLRHLRRLIQGKDDPVDSETFAVTYGDFQLAVTKVQPSAKREGFATIPDTTWAEIGALHEVRDKLSMAIVEPIKEPQRFAVVGVTAPAGVLLWGPPGCGKTLLAKAVANESRANFISIKGPELLNKYVGESERAVRQVFERARSSVPCILFFDELDALVPKREDSLSEASSKVVNTLLTEMDGLSNRAGIYVVAATNRPDQIDPAMLRPGRLGTSVFVDLPTPPERIEILRALLKKALPAQNFEDVLDVVLDKRCDGYSGADINNLHHAAAIAALKRDTTGGDSVRILREDWETALATTKPSVHDVARYRRLQNRGM